MKVRKYFLIAFFLIVGMQSSIGQFYNGHQMTFGKNRIQYTDFFWFYYRFEKFDMYYGSDGREIAEYAANVVQKRLPNLERFFEHQLDKRIIFVVYSKQSYFKQSNIGLVSGNEESNTGGVSKIIDNKVFLYFEGDHKKFEQQIVNAIAEVIFTELLYGGNMRERIASNTMLNIPDWYSKGLFSYLSSNWNIDIENKIKDAFEKKRYKKLNTLTEENAEYAGHSFWNFIAETYGENVIPNIIYFTKINRSADEGFIYVLGKSMKELAPEWLEFYNDRFKKNVERQNLPDSLLVFKRPKQTRVFQNIKLSPDGNTIAYSTNERGRFIVWLYDIKKHKAKKIFRGGIKLRQITDYSFPLLAWPPSGEFISIIIEKEGLLRLYNYTLEDKSFQEKSLQYLDKVLDFSYSDDGSRIVFSAVKKGLVDIFVYRTTSATFERITNDIADDFYPRFINKSSQIIFSSNRQSDSLSTENKEILVSENTDLFVYNYNSKSQILKRITASPMFNEIRPFEIRKDIFAYLSDENGVNNRQIAKLDSIINFVDTTTHYRFFTRFYPLTNYNRNILDHSINPKSLQFADIIYNNNRFYSYFGDLNTKRDAAKGNYRNTFYRDKFIKTKILKDSLQLRDQQLIIKQIEEAKKIQEEEIKNQVKIPNPDSVMIDVNNYLFEQEKYTQQYTQADNQNKNKQTKQFNLTPKAPNTKLKLPEQRNYYLAFYPYNLVSQVDFNFLNASYQAFTGDAVYFNPGLNAMFKVGINDLFEDYKVVGGVQLAADLQSNEFLVSFENLKYRLDKQFIYHRQVFVSSPDNYDIQKTKTNDFIYQLSYPLSEASSLRASLTLRYDKSVILSTDYNNVNKPTTYKSFTGVKLEHIFDNTISLGTNLYEGTRSKIFFEFYKEVAGNKTDLFVVGADYRHYIRIHRSLIFATRFAGSTSFGGSQLMYFLGGVDNWINLSSTVPTFDKSVQRNKTKNWVFQTAATNMRGFTQNIRNGNSFVLMNNEIRFPVFKYLANRPLSSIFLDNFQVVGFFDAGTAWTGLSPKSDENEYNKTIYPDPETVNTGSNTPIKVIVDNRRSLLVAGYGFGIRSRILGYFARFDWAWGIENQTIMPRIFYLSLNLDF